MGGKRLSPAHSGHRDEVLQIVQRSVVEKDGAGCEVMDVVSRGSPPTGSNATRTPLPSVVRSMTSPRSSTPTRTTSFAPGSRSSDRFFSERVVATTFAPSACAISMAPIPAELAAAVTSTVSSDLRLATSAKAKYGVRYCSHTGQAWASESSGGARVRWSAGRTVVVACTPSVVVEKGMPVTWSPMLRAVTFSPISVTVPLSRNQCVRGTPGSSSAPRG